MKFRVVHQPQDRQNPRGKLLEIVSRCVERVVTRAVAQALLWFPRLFQATPCIVRATGVGATVPEAIRQARERPVMLNERRISATAK